jgi:hypothetical protein
MNTSWFSGSLPEPVEVDVPDEGFDFRLSAEDVEYLAENQEVFVDIQED